eukprot:gnl/Spiro4/723_TR406_c0_g1_i1.p1 gnl/Spiro4/723_TR406_c0_g1~~gnl/Spiro4/723_TR406_c0_g1_i1.p1  ORF type:complete len:465 (+),score=65.68 gnl/Spiro4/723_TR406_c0_g1_i1:69-1463(+)
MIGTARDNFCLRVLHALESWRLAIFHRPHLFSRRLGACLSAVTLLLVLTAGLAFVIWLVAVSTDPSVFVPVDLATRLMLLETVVDNFRGRLMDVNHQRLSIARSATIPSFLISTMDPALDRVISSSLHRDGFWDPHIAELFFYLLDGQCDVERLRNPLHVPLVVDVGANLGFFGLYAAKMGCRSILVEPQQRLLTHIALSAALNSFALAPSLEEFRGASSRHSARVLLLGNAVTDNITATPSVSFVELNELGEHGGSHITEGEHRERRPHRTTVVPTVRLDEIIDEEVLLMKVDVEAHEFHVLRSLDSLLAQRSIRNIVLEFDAHRLGIDGGVALLTFLSQHGFAVSVMRWHTTLFYYSPPPALSLPVHMFRTYCEAMAAVDCSTAGAGECFDDLWFSIQPQEVTGLWAPPAKTPSEPDRTSGNNAAHGHTNANPSRLRGATSHLPIVTASNNHLDASAKGSAL